MNSEHWKRIDSLLQSVLERRPEERDAFLWQACTGDEALERVVRSLLRAQQGAGSFLENPAIEVAARELGLEHSDGDSPAGPTISAAAAEFQRIIDHPGLVPGDPVGAVARLQLGRAFALSGDSAKAKAAYQDFLSLWKDADRDVPILTQAKAEYQRLQ